MFCRHVFGNISGGFCGILHFLGEFHGISRKYLNFAAPRPREISEALSSERYRVVMLMGSVQISQCGFVCEHDES